MRLNSIAEAVMGSKDYTPPNEPQKLMADFYALDLLKSGIRNHPSDRTDNIDYEIKIADSALLDHMKHHMLQMVGYSIASELRHLFDAAVVDYWPVIGESYDSEPEDSLCDVCGGDLGDCFCCKECGKPDCICRQRDRNAEFTDGWYDKVKWLANFMDEDTVEQFAAMMDSMDFGFVIDHIDEIIKAADYAFDSEFVTWKRSYGGQPWHTAVGLWKKLKSSSGEQIRMVVDRIYQQQHNTGSLLNKNEQYRGGWLDMMLNLKFVANDPEQLIPMASGYIRKLTGYVLHNKYGRGFDVSSVGGPAADVKQHMLEKFLVMAKSKGFKIAERRNGSATIEHLDTRQLFEINVFYYSRKSTQRPINYYNVVCVDQRMVLSNSENPEYALEAILLYLGV